MWWLNTVTKPLTYRTVIVANHHLELILRLRFAWKRGNNKKDYPTSDWNTRYRLAWEIHAEKRDSHQFCGFNSLERIHGASRFAIGVLGFLLLNGAYLPQYYEKNNSYNCAMHPTVQNKFCVI